MALVQALVKKGLLDKEKGALLDSEIKTSGRREEEVIMEKGIVNEETLFNLKSEILKIPLKIIDIEDITREVLELIPEETARYYRMTPLLRDGDILEMGMVYPEDSKAQEALKFIIRKERLSYKVFLITPSFLEILLKKYRTLKKEVGQALGELETELREGKEEAGVPTTAAEVERLVEEAPITKAVAVMLRYAVEGGASDIHIEPVRDRLRIRFRVLGRLYSSLALPLKIHPAIVTRVKILSNLRIDEARIPQDGRFSTQIGERYVDFRVSTFPTAFGEKVAIRVLDPTVGLKKIEELGLEGRNFEVVEAASKKPFGLILSTGPTGSGKTTTLYSILNILNKEDVNVITLEDPIEYFIEGINQSQVRPEIGYSFATGLRQVLRQDPNIIMVGEIRDSETASLAIHAALTGHIVLSTLHTNNAIGVIPRLIDLGIQPYLISPTLSAAIAQRLVRSLCSYCRKQVKPTKEIKDVILKEIENLPLAIKKDFQTPSSLLIYDSVGCKKCGNTGYSGRVAVFEVLSMTPQLEEIVLRQPSEATIQEEAKRQGMLTMKQDGILKVLRGITTLEEVLRVAEEK